jgi:hypothetical protein
MDKTNEYVKITEADLSFLKEELLQINKPLTLNELAQKVAFKKTSSQLKQTVNKYDPYCEYEAGDLIFKEYDEPLLVSSKGAEHFRGSVVLKVLNKISMESFDCDMLEVGYSGGGIFRKHIDYMKKTKTQVLLPSNCDHKKLSPQKLNKEDDPRLDQVPMTDKDLVRLEKNLGKALAKAEGFFCWSDFWQLTSKRIEVSNKIIEEIKKLIRETTRSMSTDDLCSRFFNKDSTDDLFDLHCLSLNHVLEKKHKKIFAFVSPLDWGRWHLKETLDSFMKGLPLSTSNAKVPALEEENKQEISPAQKFPLKIYLTWREIHSGGIKVPTSIRRSLADFREYTFTDNEGNKDYTVYYYPSPGIFLGLKEFYEDNNVPQGASLTLEKKKPGHIHFWLKKSKKKLSVPQVTYDAKKDRFSETGEEVFTFSLPNKIIHLEKNTLSRLCSLYDQKPKLNLKELLILIFNYFGIEGETLFLHYLRAFHLVDVLKQTTQEDVEKTLLFSPEFSKSEKKKGIFFYKEKIRAEADIPAEETIEIPAEVPDVEEIKEVPGEAHLAIGTIEEEVPAPKVEEEIIVVEEEAKVVEKGAEEAKEKDEEPSLPETTTPPIKEKAEKKKKEIPPKKKKKERRMIEGEAAPRRRKGEKKFIEERIELEEFEHEALVAVKEKRDKTEDRVAVKEREADFKAPIEEQPTFGIFAEKLKVALDKQDKKEEDKKAPEKKAAKDAAPKPKKKTEKTPGKKPAKKTGKKAEKNKK